MLEVRLLGRTVNVDGHADYVRTGARKFITLGSSSEPVNVATHPDTCLTANLHCQGWEHVANK